MRQQRKEKDRRITVLIIAICTMMTFPMLMIPVGLRESTPPGVLVGRAYADAYPYSDQEEEVLVEDWALQAGVTDTENTDIDPTADPSSDPTSDPSADPTEDPNATVDPSLDPDATGEDDPIDPNEPDEPEDPDMPVQTVDPETGRVLIEVGEGEAAVDASYIDETAQREKKYANLMTAQVIQTNPLAHDPVVAVLDAAIEQLFVELL